jgi:serine/threonine-protein kinase PpkA
VGRMVISYLLILGCVCYTASAQHRRTPLLMKGKTSLYQTVLTKPGAVLYQYPDSRAPELRHLRALNIFFVYDRRTLDGKEWLEVGPERMGPSEGWLPHDTVIDWKQTLTLVFTNRSERDPTLFFRDHDQLRTLMDSELMFRDVSGYRKTIKSGHIPDGFPVIAVEPETPVSRAKNFYLLPILDFDFVDFNAGADYYPRTRLLKVASVTLEEEKAGVLEEGAVGTPVKKKAELLKQYRIGVVFVIDSTISMGPYIDRTREAVRRIYRRLQQSRFGQKLSFGLVAFRDNIEARPRLQYVARIFASLNDGLDETNFFRKVNEVIPAQIPSKGFNEDAFAGVWKALQDIDWSEYGGRYIVLITDAGARSEKDPYSATKLNATMLQSWAQNKQHGPFAIAVLHLLTPEGEPTHSSASRQYHTLSQLPEGGGSYYFGVEAGAVTEFGNTVDRLADEIVKQIEKTHAGEITEVPPARKSNEIERKTAIIGRAMQLAYLGHAGETKVPKLYTAWVAERDFVKPEYKTVEVRVLITKNQLSALLGHLETIFETVERVGLMNSKDFFSQLQAVVASTAREKGNIRRLADVGRMGEWLEGLPYKSRVMKTTEDYWRDMTVGEQQDLIDFIEERMELYRKLHNDTDEWVPPVDKGDAVTAMPLDWLP